MKKKVKKLKLKVKSLKLKNLLILVLVVMAITFIWAISKEKTTSSPTPSQPTQGRVLPSNLTAEEKFILQPPTADASRSAKDKHAQTVVKLAKPGNALEIKDCQPTPLVLQIKQGSEFTIKNNDNVHHKIIIDEEHIYQLPANSSLTTKAQFKYGRGDYGYVCQGAGLVGFLHLTN